MIEVFPKEVKWTQIYFFDFLEVGSKKVVKIPLAADSIEISREGGGSGYWVREHFSCFWDQDVIVWCPDWLCYQTKLQIMLFFFLSVYKYEKIDVGWTHHLWSKFLFLFFILFFPCSGRNGLLLQGFYMQILNNFWFVFCFVTFFFFFNCKRTLSFLVCLLHLAVSVSVSFLPYSAFILQNWFRIF